MSNILNKAARFFKSQIVLCISFAAAIISMFIIPPDREYLKYIDFSVIIMLFCLMGVAAGLKNAGIFEKITNGLLKFAGNLRILSFILMNICFFSSMLVTNDVSLITFVPLTIMLYNGMGESKNCIITIIIQTAAANLGSMLTPVGNPQNLYLYTEYDLSIGFFLQTLLPIGVFSYILLSLLCLLVGNDKIKLKHQNSEPLKYPNLIVMSALFIVCILTVLRLVPHVVCLVIVCIGFLIEPKLFIKVDYALLLTFICFFVFVGNISRIEIVRDYLSGLMNGHELFVSAISSQIISNVPAAVMLSAFTDNARELLRGVNIGGLGTPVASLASLISYQLYAKSKGALKGKYMSVFLIINFAFLIILMLIARFVI